MPRHSSRDVQSYQKQNRRTQYYKYGLIGAAFTLVVLALMWPKINQVILLFTAHRVGRVDIDVSKIDLRNKFVENPKYIGGGETPYTLLAERAQQTSPHKIILTHIKGRITLKDHSELSVLANEGDMHIDGVPKGTLKGDVTFIYNKGDTEVWTDHVHIDMKAGTLATSHAVRGASAFGTLYSPKGLLIQKKEGFLRLNGPAEVMIDVEGTQ